MKLICLLLLGLPWVRGADPKPPSFPSDFEVNVEVNPWYGDGIQSYTIAYTAKGNGEGNMLYIVDTTDGKRDMKVFNFDKDLFIFASSRDGTCKQVGGIPNAEKDAPLFPVAFEAKGRSKTFQNPDSLFRFDGGKVLNGTTASGITTWMSKTIFKSDKDGALQCDLQFDWTKNGTSTPLCERTVENGGVCPPIPVQATLDCGDDRLIGYLFSSYTETLDYTVFEPPVDYYCEGRDAKSLPQFSKVFSLKAENILPVSKNKVWNSQLWVDTVNKVVATRYRKEDNDVKVVTDYTSGFEYELNVHSGRCVPKVIGDSALTQELVNELVWGEPVATDNQLSGYHPCRLWKCAVYAGFLGEGKVQNLYYAQDEDTGMARRPTYMETRINGVIQSQRHVFGYTENVPDWSQLDLYRCFHREDIRVFSVVVEGDTDFDGDVISPADVRESYRSAVVKALNISQPLRLTRFYHIPDPSKRGLTAVTFLYPAQTSKNVKVASTWTPTSSRKNSGDSLGKFPVYLPSGVTDISSDDAIQRLTQLVAKGQFAFPVQTKTAKEVTYKGVSVSGVRKGNEAAPSTAERTRGYSSGSMAGLGFGMLFLGAVVAVAVVAAVTRFYPGNQFTASLLQSTA